MDPAGAILNVRRRTGSSRCGAQAALCQSAGNETQPGLVVSGMNANLERIVMAEGVARLAGVDADDAFRQLSASHVRSAYRLPWAIPGDDCDAETTAVAERLHE